MPFSLRGDEEEEEFLPVRDNASTRYSVNLVEGGSRRVRPFVRVLGIVYGSGLTTTNLGNPAQLSTPAPSTRMVNTHERRNEARLNIYTR